MASLFTDLSSIDITGTLKSSDFAKFLRIMTKDGTMNGIVETNPILSVKVCALNRKVEM